MDVLAMPPGCLYQWGTLTETVTWWDLEYTYTNSAAETPRDKPHYLSGRALGGTTVQYCGKYLTAHMLTIFKAFLLCFCLFVGVCTRGINIFLGGEGYTESTYWKDKGMR